MSLLELFTQRSVIVGLALAGAALTMIGAIGRPAFRGAVAIFAVSIGYGLTGVSLALFILAGFLTVR